MRDKYGTCAHCGATEGEAHRLGCVSTFQGQLSTCTASLARPNTIAGAFMGTSLNSADLYPHRLAGAAAWLPPNPAYQGDYQTVAGQRLEALGRAAGVVGSAPRERGDDTVPTILDSVTKQGHEAHFRAARLLVRLNALAARVVGDAQSAGQAGSGDQNTASAQPKLGELAGAISKTHNQLDGIEAAVARLEAAL